MVAVLGTLYEPTSKKKCTNNQNCEFCGFIKVVLSQYNYIFHVFTFGQFY